MSSLVPSLSLSFLTRSSPLPSSPSRSHALCLRPFLFFLVVLLFSSTTANPYYDRDGGDERDDDGSSVFETDGSSNRPSSSNPSPIPFTRTSTTTRTETTTDTSLRTENITPHPTVLSPHIVSALQPTHPLPTVLSFEISTSVVTTTTEANPTASLELELQNSRMIEIIANLTKKLETQQSAGTEVSISFTPDELKKMQEIIGATGLKLKENFETKKRQLMIPDGPVKISDPNNGAKQHIPEKVIYHEEETVSSTLPPDTNFTVIDEATLPPTESIPDDLVLSEAEQEFAGHGIEPIDEVLEESIRPALCKMNIDDDLISVIWILFQSHIREWGYDEDQSTALVLTAFGLLFDSEGKTVILTVEHGFLDDIKAGIHCVFRDCTLAMPTKKVPPRELNESMVTSPKMKREAIGYHSDLFECHCPNGYVFA